MLVDYGDISQALAPLVHDYLDHHDLNQTLGGVLSEPTSEAVARWIYEQLKYHPVFITDLQRVHLDAVIIEETCTAACEYSEA